MQITLETGAGRNIVRALEPGRLRVSDEWLSGSLILAPTSPVQPWSATSVASLQWNDLQILIERKPEIILLGSGARLVFPAAELAARVLASGIGIETMDTAAACRTYNILVGEDRNVVAGIIQDET